MWIGLSDDTATASDINSFKNKFDMSFQHIIYGTRVFTKHTLQRSLKKTNMLYIKGQRQYHPVASYLYYNVMVL